MAGNTDKGASGPPRWTYAVGALVAAGGLVWGIVSYFIPKPQPKPPGAVEQIAVPRQEAKAEGGTAINASDSARVMIGAPPVSDAGSPATSQTTHTAPVDQSAEAGAGGVAVNASGDAEVTVDSAEQGRR